MKGRVQRMWQGAVAAACLFALLGCAQQRIRDRSQDAVARGEYEQAIGMLEAGVKEYPDSALLRSGLLRLRSDATGQLLAEAASLRAAGRHDEARQRLQRALQIDPRDTRATQLLSELDAERRQQAALVEAEALLAKGQAGSALRTVEEALKDNPRHPGLRTLQRRVELEDRQSRAQQARSGLAETRPISLDFRDANLRTVLDVVARSSGLNFVLDRDIRADLRVTVYLNQARVEEALDLITGTNQLAKKVLDEKTVLLYPNTPDKQREYQEQVVRVFQLGSAEAKGAAAFLRSMLRIKEPFVDERTNLLALRDTPENIRLAERLVALYDAGEPEVLLEVEVLEISSTRLTELGVKFPDSFSLTPLAPDGGTDLTLGNIRGLNRDRIALGVGGLLVNLKREVGDFTTLANPRIRARNKEKAKVLIGDKIPVITTTTGTGGFVSDSVNYIDVGLKLDVEPTVYPDDEVAIRVALEVSTLGSAVKTSSGALAYQIGTRNASTLLRLGDGETQLLAGLISRDDRSSSSRVPGVGDMPVLGRLFSSQLDNAQRTELVLAITPRVLKNIRRPDASESELWVGTDAQPRLRQPLAVKGPDSRVGELGPSTAASAASAAAVTREEANTASGPTTVRFSWSGPQAVAVGDTVELSMDIDSLPPLRGMPMLLRFDHERLRWIDAEEGDFFRRGGAPSNFSQSVDAAGGRLRVGLMRQGEGGVGGKGRVMTLKFQALAAGLAEVGLEEVRPIAVGKVPAQVGLNKPWSIEVKQ